MIRLREDVWMEAEVKKRLEEQGKGSEEGKLGEGREEALERGGGNGGRI